MSTDEHYACIGRTFTRRKNAVRELDDLEKQAKQVGATLAVVATALKQPEKIGTRTQQAIPAGVQNEPLYSPAEEVMTLIDQIAALRREIRELDDLLSS